MVYDPQTSRQGKIMYIKEEDIVARSVSVEIAGDISRCSEGEDTRFFCLPVIIHFDNGQKVQYLLKSHNEKKGIENFLNNKKGIRDNLEKRFVLLKDGSVKVVY